MLEFPEHMLVSRPYPEKHGYAVRATLQPQISRPSSFCNFCTLPWCPVASAISVLSYFLWAPSFPRYSPLSPGRSVGREPPSRRKAPPAAATAPRKQSSGSNTVARRRPASEVEGQHLQSQRSNAAPAQARSHPWQACSAPLPPREAALSLPLERQSLTSSFSGRIWQLHLPTSRRPCSTRPHQEAPLSWARRLQGQASPTPKPTPTPWMPPAHNLGTLSLLGGGTAPTALPPQTGSHTEAFLLRHGLQDGSAECSPAPPCTRPQTAGAELGMSAGCSTSFHRSPPPAAGSGSAAEAQPCARRRNSCQAWVPTKPARANQRTFRRPDC